LVLLNIGDSVFAPAVNYGSGFHPNSVVIADFDSDSDNDLAVAMNMGVSIFKNDGAGDFPSETNFGDYINPPTVCFGDFDNDRDNDLAVVDSHSDSLSIAINNGDGEFVRSTGFAVGHNPRSVFTADFDSDGDSDLAVANRDSNSVSVFLNRTYSTDVESGGEARPRDYLLTRNYPNPFNACATIEYTLSEPSTVSIDIYDISGRKLQSLFDGENPAGEHRVTWDAKGIVSGIYFCKITTGNMVGTQKMVLLK